MAQATAPGGALIPIDNCFIQIGNSGPLLEQIMLPDITDSKSASYPEEALIGRSTPLKTYSHSETRTISWTMHFIVCKETDIDKNLANLRAIESCVYPGNGNSDTPYTPPGICQIQCGFIFGDNPLCVVMKSYSVKFPPDVAWDQQTMLPYKFDVDMSFEVVYDSEYLPGADRILTSGE